MDADHLVAEPAAAVRGRAVVGEQLGLHRYRTRRIRTAAGQLTAEHTIAEAEAELLRITDTHGTVERVGDDRFKLCVDESR